MTLAVGMIGLDTSHVPAFTKLLNDESDPHHVPGAKVVVAYPGASPDFALSADRVDGFTNELRNDFGVQIVDSPEAVADAHSGHSQGRRASTGSRQGWGKATPSVEEFHTGQHREHGGY